MQFYGRSNSVKKDLKRNWVVVCILCTGMLPLLMDEYCCYILVVLAPLVFFTKKWDSSFGILAAFGVIYTFALLVGGQTVTSSAFIFHTFYPAIMYQSGVWIAGRFNDKRTAILLLALMVLCMALPALYFNIKDAITSGELINMFRSVVYDSGKGVRSATGYGMMLAMLIGCIGLILIPADNKFNKKLKFILVTGAICAIFSTVHLLNRTGLVLAAAAIVTAVSCLPVSRRRSVYTFVVLSILIIVFFVFQKSQFMFDAVTYYTEREEEGSLSSLGSRDVLMMAAVEQLFNNPLGGAAGLRYGNSYSYAHNLWLDVGLKGGIVCLIILIVILLELIKGCVRLLKNESYTHFERVFIILISVTLVLQCMVEPVYEGLPQMFWFFLFLLGILKVITTNKYVGN